MAQVALLACAWIGCTRTNPAFDQRLPADADEAGAESSTDGGPRLPVLRDGASLVADLGHPVDVAALSDGAGAPADSAPVAIDSAPVVVDAAPDLGGAAVGEVTGLAGYWPLDEGTSNSMVMDHSGNGNNGHLAVVDPRTAWVAGHAGAAVAIPDQVGAGVVIPASASLDRLKNAFTFSAWVYREGSVNDRNYTILSRQFGTGGRELYSFSFQGSALTIWLYQATSTQDLGVHATMTAPLKSWVHVAVSWDGKMVRLYQAGALLHSASYGLALPTSTNPLILGNNANATGLDQPLAGRLDEVRIYDRALSASEIAALAK